MAYKDSKAFVEVGDTIMVNSGKELEDDQPKTVMVPERDEEGELTGRDVEVFNSQYHIHRNSRSRVILPNGKPFRLLAEIGGVVDFVNPVAVMNSKCKVNERQPFYVRVRMEDPITNIPTAPAEVTG